MIKHGVKGFAFLAGCLALLSPVAAAELVIPGSGDCEYVLARLAEAFEKLKPGSRIVVPASTGSAGGVAAVQDNQAILGRIARALKPEEERAGLKTLQFGRDPVVFAVGERVTLKSISEARLLEVFGGKVRNWSELGGDAAPIRLVVREKTDTSFVVISKLMPRFAALQFDDSAKLVAKTPEMIDLLARYKTAIGWATASAIKAAGGTIRALAIEGVEPGPATVASGKYPLATDYALVFREERLTREAREFMAYVVSPAGQELLRSHGLAAPARR